MNNVKTLILFSIISINIFAQEWFWQNPLPQGNTLYSSDMISENSGIAVGDAWTIISSNNSGNDWSLTPKNFQTSLKSVNFLDEHNAFAVGEYGSIFKTDDGLNWGQVYSDSNFVLNSISIFSTMIACAVGEDLSGVGNIILWTTNGGLSWESKTSGSINGLYAVAVSYTHLTLPTSDLV